MTLEQFTKSRATDWPSVTIRRSGTISLNHKAIENFELKDKEFIALYFDTMDSIIGIKPLDNNEDPFTFKITKERGRTFTISCQSFLKHFRIPYKETSKVFKATWDEETTMILVKL